MSTPGEEATEAQLEEKFETDRAFADEPIEQSLGRLVWMTVQRRTEFILMLRDLGIDPETTAKAAIGFASAQQDYIDYVWVGLNAGTYDVPRDEHPQEAALNAQAYRLMGLDEGNKVASDHLGDETRTFSFYEEYYLVQSGLDALARRGLSDDEIDTLNESDDDTGLGAFYAGLGAQTLERRLIELDPPEPMDQY